VAETALATTHPLAACPDPGRHCIPHGTDGEPLAGYRWCFECQHMFATASDLLAAHNAVLAGMGLDAEGDVERVACCAFCTHDW
jgi:hypothetical protein